MKTIQFVSDFYVNEVNGGAEANDFAYIQALTTNLYQNDRKGTVDAPESKVGGQYVVECHKTAELTIETVKDHSDDLWVFGNFAHFKDYKVMTYFYTNNIKYIHISNDHIYCLYRNPLKHNAELKCDCYDPSQNLHLFLKNALAIVCQSKWHKEIWEKNVISPRIISIGNLWDTDILNYIESKLNESVVKNEKYLIWESSYEHKNTAGALQEATRKGLEYELVKDLPQKLLIDKLIESKGIIFIPTLCESYSRWVAEARMFNCKIITNNLCGVTKEDHFKLKGIDFVNYIRNEPPKKLVELIDVLYNNVVK